MPLSNSSNPLSLCFPIKMGIYPAHYLWHRELWKELDSYCTLIDREKEEVKWKFRNLFFHNLILRCLIFSTIFSGFSSSNLKWARVSRKCLWCSFNTVWAHTVCIRQCWSEGVRSWRRHSLCCCLLRGSSCFLQGSVGSWPAEGSVSASALLLREICWIPISSTLSYRSHFGYITIPFRSSFPSRRSLQNTYRLIFSTSCSVFVNT